MRQLQLCKLSSCTSKADALVNNIREQPKRHMHTHIRHCGSLLLTRVATCAGLCCRFLLKQQQPSPNTNTTSLCSITRLD